MSVDPPEDLRPPRETALLGLPVPGDADAADAPTAIGDLADAIDALVALGYIGVGTGDIKMSARTVAPSGWLLCDGRLVSRTVFADLFAAIGVAYGAGDGNTTFAIPDYRNVFPVGAASLGATGARGGAASVGLAVAEMPHHAHGVYDPSHAHSVADPTHGHGGYTSYNEVFGGQQAAASGSPPIFTGTGQAGANGNPAPRVNPGGYWGGLGGGHSHDIAAYGAGVGIGIYGAATGISLYGEGGGAAHENRPPFASVNFFIKT